MTPDNLDTERLQEIICDAFEGVYDDEILYTPEGLLARSALILLWALNPLVPQSGLDLILRQVSEHIEYLAKIGLISSETLQEALSIIADDADDVVLTKTEDEIFQDLMKHLK